ncbi:uncharacterized protein si:dkey-17o15.2 isoform X2 [Engraulis encrasicolus]|uniref:uncharacterized protein si:dkey-17o15.2 isoform X2 n=1 Tax=Engraulis encrasicolus TaxID=184585 RepID=UPI002FD3D259
MGDATTEEPQPMQSVEEPMPVEVEEAVEEPDSRNSEKIDMSLDDIIKKNKEEKKAQRAEQAKNKRLKTRNNVLKKLNKEGQQAGGYRSWYTGPGFRGFYKRRGFGAGRGAFRGSGISPLDRPSLDAKATGQFGQTKNAFRGSFANRYRGRGRGRGQASGRGGDAAARGGRPFTLNRGFSTTSRGGAVERFQKVRGWKRNTSLTVSLSNSKAANDQG